MHRRLLRSVLFTPADRLKAMEKSKALLCDTVIFDLEDAVGPNKKLAAREDIIPFLSSWTRRSMKVVVRVNGLDTAWGKQDIEELSKANLDAILIPKTSTVSDVMDAQMILDSCISPVPLWCMIETARGVQNVDAIAATKNVECLVFGSNDLSKELKCQQTAARLPLLYSMSRCIVAARAEGRFIVDGVHVNFKDTAGFSDSCIQGKELGFDGKSLIHPDQVEPANRLYSPTPELIAHYKAIVKAWDVAVLEGKGVTSVNGALIEQLHVDEAKNILSLFNEI